MKIEMSGTNISTKVETNLNEEGFSTETKITIESLCGVNLEAKLADDDQSLTIGFNGSVERQQLAEQLYQLSKAILNKDICLKELKINKDIYAKELKINWE